MRAFSGRLNRRPDGRMGSRVAVLFLLLALALLGPWWALPDEGAPAALSAEASQAAREQASALVRLLVDTPDPLKPDEAARAVLQAAIRALGGSEPVLVFNGKVYPKVLVVGVVDEGDPEAYFLKPDDKAVARPEYLPLVQKRDYAPEKDLAGLDPVHRETVELFLKGTPTAAQVQAVLAARKADGTITAFDWLPSARRLLYTLKGDEDSTELYPALEAEALRYVARAYGEPQEYARKTLAETRRRMAAGEALVVNTRQKPPVQVFLPREVLREDLEILADPSLTPDQKLERYSRGLELGRAELFESPALASSGPAAWAAPAPTARELLDKPGVIVPPSKRIGYLRGPDHIINRQFQSQVRGGDLTGVATLKSREGPLACYHQNGYTLEVTTAQWNRPFVETLDRIFRDDGVSILYFHTHGGIEDGMGVLLAELYDIGRFAKPGDEGYVALTPAEGEEFSRNARAFRARVADLKARYPGNQIATMNVRSKFRPEGAAIMRKFEAGLPDRIREAMDPHKRRSMGAILVTSNFVANSFAKARKSVVMLQACHSGAVAPSIRARVVLAPTAEDMTSELTFLDSDLRKIGDYLYQRKDPGPVAVTAKTMRNYDVVRDLPAPPSYYTLPTEDAIFDAEAKVAADPGRLASLRLYGADGQTVSPSPHVVEALPDRIVFSAPMDDSIPAEEVVSLDFRYCPDVEEKVRGLKPTWKSATEIELPWNGKAYREWKDEDFSGGSPATRYVIVRVDHRRAVSTISRVPLTGNPDAFSSTSHAARVREGWREPARLQINATRPQTDFTYALPCFVPGEHVPIAAPPGDEYVSTILWADKDGNLFRDGEKIIDHDGTSRDRSGPTLSIGTYEPLAAFGSNVAWERETDPKSPSVPGYNEVFYNGSVLSKGRPRTVGIRLFGSHYLVDLSGDHDDGPGLLYDGRTLQRKDLGATMLTTTSLVSVNDRSEVKVDGSTVGTTLPGFRPMDEGIYLGGKYSSVYAFRDALAFLGPDGHVKYRSGGAAGLKDLGAGKDVVLFGEHVAWLVDRVYKPRPNVEVHSTAVVYDGKEIGPGGDHALFGDSLAFLSTSNPETGRGPCFEAPPVVPGQTPTWTRKGEPHFMDNRYVFFNGKYFDAAKKLKLSLDRDYQVWGLRIFGEHVAFCLGVFPKGGDRISLRLVYDWKDVGETNGTYMLFGDHYVYLRDAGTRQRVIYDGKDMGEGVEPVIYKGRLAFRFDDPETGRKKVRFDGKDYPYDSSIMDNMHAAVRYYLENDVKTSPYGTLKWAPPSNARGEKKGGG